MKSTSPIMVQYQHPMSLVGMPPLILISIAVLGSMSGVLCAVFIGVAVGFIVCVIVSAFLFVGFKRFAKGDRHAEKVYLSGLFYWLNNQAQYSAGDGR